MIRGYFFFVLAALLLVGTEASRILQQDPSHTIQCLDMTNDAVVKQGTTGKCAEMGGEKVCGQYGRWHPTKGTCSDKDLSIKRDAQGRPIFISGPQPSATPDRTIQCKDMFTQAVVKQGTTGKCVEGGGMKECGQYGRWYPTKGSCTDKDLSIERDSKGNPIFISGPQPLRRLASVTATPDRTIQCKDMFTEAVVKQGTTGKCVEGGGMKECGQYGRWYPTKGTCTDKDLSIERDAQGRPIFVSGPQPSATPDRTIQCKDMFTQAVVKQGTTGKCVEAGGMKECGQYGRWRVTKGSCTDKDLSIERDAKGNPIFISGGQP